MVAQSLAGQTQLDLADRVSVLSSQTPSLMSIFRRFVVRSLEEVV